MAKVADAALTAKSFVSALIKAINQKGQLTPADSAKWLVAALSPSGPANGIGEYWQKWGTALTIGGAVMVAGAAATAAYRRKEEIGVGYSWVEDHMKYVGNLWDEKELNKRLETVVGYDRRMGILFRT